MLPSAPAEPETKPPAFEVSFGEHRHYAARRARSVGCARHDMLVRGGPDPLYAKAVVIRAGDDKLAIVARLGRGPTEPMMEIFGRARRTGRDSNVMISGSTHHHGPVIEFTDSQGFGKGEVRRGHRLFTNAPGTYRRCDPRRRRVASRPAWESIAIGSDNLNRNRQSKRVPKATDPMLAVIRFDDPAGKPIAVLVNFAAHPVMTNEKILKYSADYPGFLKNKVALALATQCIFMQGAVRRYEPESPGHPMEAQRIWRDRGPTYVIALASSQSRPRCRRTRRSKALSIRFLFQDSRPISRTRSWPRTIPTQPSFPS